MALTMRRTRTQTALTKLAELVACIHGELAFVELLLAAPSAADARPGLERRRDMLQASRDALYLTVMQFDPDIDPGSIGTSDAWLKPFGRGVAARKRYQVSFGFLRFVTGNPLLPASTKLHVAKGKGRKRGPLNMQMKTAQTAMSSSPACTTSKAGVRSLNERDKTPSLACFPLLSMRTPSRLKGTRWSPWMSTSSWPVVTHPAKTVPSRTPTPARGSFSTFVIRNLKPMIDL
jgi:hypothetical protein